MSWKSIVITGLLCVLASPVLADPAVSAKLLGLDVNGNWVWQVNVSPDAGLFADNPPNGVGGSVALEIAATASQRNLVSAAANTTNFPNNNPGAAVPGFDFWTGNVDLGLETNVATNQLVAALGSTYFTTGGDKEAFLVRTQGPTSTALSTTLTLSGAYSGSGRLAQGGSNFDTVSGANVKGVLGGNANLSSATDLGDLAILGANYDAAHANPGKHWQQADFTGDGFVDLGDLAVLGANYGTSGTADPNWTVSGQVNIPAPGAGSIAGAVVPEPASLLLVVCAAFALSMTGRRR